MLIQNCGYFLYNTYNQSERKFNLFSTKSSLIREVKLSRGHTFHTIQEIDNGVVRGYINNTDFIIISAWDLALSGELPHPQGAGLPNSS